MKFNKLGAAALALAGSITSTQAMMQDEEQRETRATDVAKMSIGALGSQTSGIRCRGAEAFQNPVLATRHVDVETGAISSVLHYLDNLLDWLTVHCLDCSWSVDIGRREALHDDGSRFYYENARSVMETIVRNNAPGEVVVNKNLTSQDDSQGKLAILFHSARCRGELNSDGWWRYRAEPAPAITTPHPQAAGRIGADDHLLRPSGDEYRIFQDVPRLLAGLTEEEIL